MVEGVPIIWFDALMNILFLNLGIISLPKSKESINLNDSVKKITQ